MDQFPNFFWQPDASNGTGKQKPNKQTQTPQVNNPTDSTPGLNQFPNFFWQLDASNGTGSQQPTKQTQVPQFNNPADSTPGLNQFPSSFCQFSASTGAGNQQPNRQAQAPQVNNFADSTPGLNQFPDSVWQFDASKGAGNQQAPRQAQALHINNPIYQQPSRQAQAPQVNNNNPGYSMSGLFDNVPGELPMDYGSTVPGTGMYSNSAFSNAQASGHPEPDTPAINGPQVSTSTAPELEDNGQQIVVNPLARNRHLSDEEFARRYKILEYSNDQASGHPESDTVAVNSLQVSNPLTFGNFEEDEFLRRVPAQASSSGLSGNRSSQEALKSQSSGSGPQTSGSGHDQPNHQAPNPGLPGFGDLSWQYEPSFFRPGPTDGNHAWGIEAYEMQLTFAQSSASQTPVALATSSDANNGYGYQAHGHDLLHSESPAFQSISSSDGQMGALQTTGRTPNAQRLISARGPDLEITQGQGMFEDISQNSNSLVSVPESPRPPQSKKGQGDSPDSRYCISCKEKLASFALRCDFCKQMHLYDLPEYRHCIFCRKFASGPKSIVCADHERRMTVRLSDDEKRVLEREGICKRCYKAEACPGILKCERCRSDQKRYGATSRESRGQRGICLNCSNSVGDSEFRNCEECRQKKAEGCKLARQQARDKGS
ncbi:uncharacterized protein FTOL_03689 [Fusarium torulosum]|uniref:Uncharacterized protein n=1 Tax=Fusarium torulosum TaxID=33205 RepID=A0AAE8M4A5_9HYPO|nr:uncharacterized protein FTOL_03689 [Fusarium torulosum]